MMICNENERRYGEGRGSLPREEDLQADRPRRLRGGEVSQHEDRPDDDRGRGGDPERRLRVAVPGVVAHGGRRTDGRTDRRMPTRNSERTRRITSAVNGNASSRRLPRAFAARSGRGGSARRAAPRSRASANAAFTREVEPAVRSLVAARRGEDCAAARASRFGRAHARPHFPRGVELRRRSLASEKPSFISMWSAAARTATASV